VQLVRGGTHGKSFRCTLWLLLNLCRRPLGPWLSALIDESSTLQDFVLWAFESSNPSVAGLALLCIAVCLQQLDPRVHQYIIRQLPRLPGELFQEYFEKVDRLILNDSDYAGTEEGIEAAILSAKIYSKCSSFPEDVILTPASQSGTEQEMLGAPSSSNCSESTAWFSSPRTPLCGRNRRTKTSSNSVMVIVMFWRCVHISRT
jgi:hypothetical protein